MNASSSMTCSLCKQLKRKSLIPKVRIIQKSDPEIMFEKANQTEEEFKRLQIRLEKAKKKLEEHDSLPPTGAIKIIVPNNWTGIVITAVVITALVTLIVLVKLIFK